MQAAQAGEGVARRRAQQGQQRARHGPAGSSDRSLHSVASRIVGARISPVHADFIENVDGQASSADVIALMVEARRRARQEGVELEHEVQMLGPIALPEG